MLCFGCLHFGVRTLEFVFQFASKVDPEIHSMTPSFDSHSAAHIHEDHTVSSVRFSIVGKFTIRFPQKGVDPVAEITC